MKNDIRSLLNGQQRLESFQEKSEKNSNDINVRLSLLEQKVLALETEKNKKR